MKTTLLICTFFITFPSFALVGVPQSLDDLYNQADYVFLSTVIKREPIFEGNKENQLCWIYSKEKPSCGTKVAYFNIEESDNWKGKLVGIHSFISPDACYCLGSYLNLGEMYVIFAIKPKDNKIDHLKVIATERPFPYTVKNLNELQSKYLTNKQRNEMDGSSEPPIR